MHDPDIFPQLHLRPLDLLQEVVRIVLVEQVQDILLNRYHQLADIELDRAAREADQRRKPPSRERPFGPPASEVLRPDLSEVNNRHGQPRPCTLEALQGLQAQASRACVAASLHCRRGRWQDDSPNFRLLKDRQD